MSQIQAAVDTLVNHATADRFQLKESKCRELCITICTKTNTMAFDSVVVNSMPIGYQWQCLLVAIAKILGLNVSSDLKWNCHFDFIIKKAIKKYLYSLSRLKIMLLRGYGCTHRLVQITSTTLCVKRSSFKILFN